MQTEEEWFICYNLVKKYYEEHGDLLIPITYVAKDENGNSINLGFWFESQKRESTIKTLQNYQIELISKFGIVDNWMKNYNLAKKYYEEHDNLLIPSTYEAKDETGEIIKLGRWISNQRTKFKNNNLSKNKIKLLNKIGMIWNVFCDDEIIFDKWIKNYNLAKEYYEKHSNLLIPSNYEVKDEEGNIVKLGNWIVRQRRAYNGDKTRRLTEKQICLLDEIDMVYNVRYYKTLVKQLDMEYNLYQYGLLDNKNVEELVENKHLMFEDSNKIIKGNAVVLSKKLAA